MAKEDIVECLRIHFSCDYDFWFLYNQNIKAQKS